MPVIEKDLLKAIEQMTEKEAFIFDMDGLIFDTERLFMEQLAVVMQEHGYRLTREIYSDTLGLGGKHLVEKMQSYYGTEYPFTKISKETAERTAVIADTVGLVVKPQIREVLMYLKKAGIGCAVASSTKSMVVRQYLEKSELFPYFQRIIGGEMVNRSKPAPDIFLLTCEKLGKKPEQCVVLEDSENGVRAALAAGCEVICIPDLKEPAQEILEKTAYVIRR